MMKTRFVIAALAAITLSPPAMAFEGGKDCAPSPLARWMSANVAVKKVQEAGMSIQNIYVVGSYFEVRACNRYGRPVLAFVDPVDGNIVQTRDRPKQLGPAGKPVCMDEMELPGQWLGVEHIYKKAQDMKMDVRGISVIGSYYEVHAIDRDNRRILAYFSPLTGELVNTRKYFPWKKP